MGRWKAPLGRLGSCIALFRSQCARAWGRCMRPWLAEAERRVGCRGCALLRCGAPSAALRHPPDATVRRPTRPMRTQMRASISQCDAPRAQCVRRCVRWSTAALLPLMTTTKMHMRRGQRCPAATGARWAGVCGGGRGEQGVSKACCGKADRALCWEAPFGAVNAWKAQGHGLCGPSQACSHHSEHNHPPCATHQHRQSLGKAPSHPCPGSPAAGAL